MAWLVYVQLIGKISQWRVLPNFLFWRVKMFMDSFPGGQWANPSPSWSAIPPSLFNHPDSHLLLWLLLKVSPMGAAEASLFFWSLAGLGFPGLSSGLLSQSPLVGRMLLILSCFPEPAFFPLEGTIFWVRLFSAENVFEDSPARGPSISLKTSKVYFWCPGHSAHCGCYSRFYWMVSLKIPQLHITLFWE